jgi:hypothetical protein
MRRASVTSTSAHNLYISMPHYYSELKQTYKDAEDAEEGKKTEKFESKNLASVVTLAPSLLLPPAYIFSFLVFLRVLCALRGESV